MARTRQAVARPSVEAEQSHTSKPVVIFSGDPPDTSPKLLDECTAAQERLNSGDMALSDLESVRDMHRRWFQSMQRICERRGDGLGPAPFPKHLLESSRQAGMYGTFVFSPEGMREPWAVMPGELRDSIGDVRTWALARLAEDMTATVASVLNGKAPTGPATAAEVPMEDARLDGPVPPKHFRFKGELHEMAPIPWRLVSAMWDCEQRSESEVINEVWGASETTDSNLKTQISRANNGLATISYGRFLSKSNGCIFWK